MSQRNPMNERYNEENQHTGKTRKSSASAKPKAARAATVRDPAPKTKKQKKEEQRERERKAQQKAGAFESRFEETEGYKRLRRYWWMALGGAIGCTVVSFVVQSQTSFEGPAMILMIIAYVLIIVAFYIDLGKIRKERKLYNASIVTNKSKEARKEQKRVRAEQREQEKEAAAKAEAAKAEAEAKKDSGLAGKLSGLFGKKKADAETAQSAMEDAETAKQPAEKNAGK